MATCSSILAWKKKIPWTEEPCRLQSMGSQRVRPDWASARIHSTAPSDALHPPHCSGTCFCLRFFAPEVGSAQDAPPQVSPWPQVSVFPSLCSKATSSVWPHRPFGLQLIPPPATPVFPRSASFPYQASAPLSLCHLLNECGYCQLSASPPECCQSHEGCDFSFIHSCIHCARNMGQLTLLISLPISFLGFPGSTVAKNLPANAGDTRDSGLIPGSGRSPAVGNGNSSILARKIPWTEDTGWLLFMGSQRVRHDWVTNQISFPVCNLFTVSMPVPRSSPSDGEGEDLSCRENMSKGSWRVPQAWREEMGRSPNTSAQGWQWTLLHTRVSCA